MNVREIRGRRFAPQPRRQFDEVVRQALDVCQSNLVLAYLVEALRPDVEFEALADENEPWPVRLCGGSGT